MRNTLERLGARMLSRVVPKVPAQAKVCACDPGSCYCQNYSIRQGCCCRSDCMTHYCSCMTSVCGAW
ncbi:hypothetical protein GCM10022379_40620 [Micromonospora maritima]